MEGDIRLTIATAEESLVPPNGSASFPPKSPGKGIYRGDEDVLCRRWNWRESGKSKLTESTTDVCLVVEGLSPFSANNRLRISDEPAELIRTRCGGRTAVHLLDGHTPAVGFGASQTKDRS